MATHPQHSQLRRLATWAGVVGAALLASAFTIAPAAYADDLEEPGSTTEPPPTTEPTDETPVPEESTDPTVDPAGQRSAAEEVDEEADDDVAALVEPNFGTRKVRVGVQLEDGSFEPGGPTTLGTTIQLSETGPSGDSISQCTTTVEGPEGSSFCEFGPPFNSYSVGPGNSLRVTQLTVNDGLEIIDGTESVGPCEQGECTEVTLLLTDGLDDDDDDDSDDDADDSESDDSDDSDDRAEAGALPDTGAPDHRLLGYGAALIAGGSLLVAGGRPRPRSRHVLID